MIMSKWVLPLQTWKLTHTQTHTLTHKCYKQQLSFEGGERTHQLLSTFSKGRRCSVQHNYIQMTESAHFTRSHGAVKAHTELASAFFFFIGGEQVTLTPLLPLHKPGLLSSPRRPHLGSVQLPRQSESLHLSALHFFPGYREETCKIEGSGEEKVTKKLKKEKH